MTVRRSLAALVLAGGIVGALTAPSGAAVTDPAATTAAVTTPDPAATTAPPADPSAAPAPAPSTTPPPDPAPSTPPPAPTTAPPPAPTPVPTTAPPPRTTPSSGTPSAPAPSVPPSSAPSPAPSPTPSSTTGSSPTPVQASGQGGSEADTGSSTPTAGDLQAQQDAIRALDDRIKAAQSDVDRAQAELQRAALVAGQALETYSQAVKALQAAQLEEQRQSDLLTQAQLALSTNRQLLGRWVRQAYADGADVTGDGDLGLVSLLGAGSTDDLGVARQYLRRVGDSRSRIVTALEQAAAVQSQAAARAQAASQAAATAAATAQTAKDAADAAVARQREVLARVEQVLAQTTEAASAQRAQLEAARADFQAALRLSAASATRDSNAITGAVGSCLGGSVENYPNGQIPLSALCPLAADPSHHLRADAAYAFDRLSRAYTARFGTPPCITDSYRTLAEQVRLYATKPNLAARPGTSNHGWGTALDLCGGIQSFGTVQHEWMFLNAPLYGWFHPAWAQPGGSRPEPWHFEFSG